MADHQYIFSIIVPTYNRKDELKELLTSLSTQSLSKDHFEILIVDDGSTDNTKDLVNNFTASTDLNITFLTQNHKGPSEARNYGMNEAKGEYFLFIDSDCIADENWLLVFFERLKQESVRPAAFGGPDKVLPSFSPVQKAIDYSMTSFITTGGMRGHSKKKISKYYPRSFNMGVRSDIVKRIGGMKLRWGEDIEFSHRIITTGEPVIKVHEAVVYHKRRISIKKFFRQVFNWGVARINLYTLDKRMLEPIHFLPAIGTIISALVILLTILFPTIFIWFLLAGIIALLLMGVHGIFKYKDFRTFFYIPVIVPTQIYGYGIGFIISFVHKFILRSSESSEFAKKYYR